MICFSLLFDLNLHEKSVFSVCKTRNNTVEMWFVPKEIRVTEGDVMNE